MTKDYPSLKKAQVEEMNMIKYINERKATIDHEIEHIESHLFDSTEFLVRELTGEQSLKWQKYKEGNASSSYEQFETLQKSMAEKLVR